MSYGQSDRLVFASLRSSLLRMIEHGFAGRIFIRVLVGLKGVIEGAYVWRLDLIISFRLLD